MSFDDFCKHFTTVTICMLVNTSVISFNKTYNEGSLKSKWEGKSAGGCVNNAETFLHNPQVSLLLFLKNFNFEESFHKILYEDFFTILKLSLKISFS